MLGPLVGPALSFFPNKNNMQHKNLAVGRYTVSPMSHAASEGHFVASVSIRSGSGASSTDRVWRFTHQFPSSASALRYATTEGANWARRH